MSTSERIEKLIGRSLEDDTSPYGRVIDEAHLLDPELNRHFAWHRFEEQTGEPVLPRQDPLLPKPPHWSQQ